MPQENVDCRTHFDVVTTTLIWNYDSIIRDPNAFTEVSNVMFMKTTQNALSISHITCNVIFLADKFNNSK